MMMGKTLWAATAIAILLTVLAGAGPAAAHGYELHGSSPYRFGISMYIARRMRVGVTQPILECWCHRLLWDKVELVVFHRADLNPASDSAWAETKARLESVDIFLVTQNAREEYAEALLEKADMMYQRPLIYVDLGIAPLVSKFEDPYPERTPPLPYFSTNAAGEMMYAIINACMRMDPSNNIEYRKNWQDFTTALELMKQRALRAQPPWQNIPIRAVSLRGGPEYLMEEAGMTIASVAPPLPDAPLSMGDVQPVAEALRQCRASVLVAAESLDAEVRAALEREGHVVLCELEPVGLQCEDDHSFDRAIGSNYNRLLQARNAVWAWAGLGK